MVIVQRDHAGLEVERKLRENYETSLERWSVFWSSIYNWSRNATLVVTWRYQIHRAILICLHPVSFFLAFLMWVIVFIILQIFFPTQGIWKSWNLGLLNITKPFDKLLGNFLATFRIRVTFASSNLLYSEQFLVSYQSLEIEAAFSAWGDLASILLQK